MKKDKKIAEEIGSYDGKDFLEDVKKLLCTDDIPDEVISSVIGYFQQNDDFMRLAVRKDEPGEYRNFLSKIVLNIPLAYANHKIEEIMKGLKNNFKLSDSDAQIIFTKSVEMAKSHTVADVLDKYVETVVNKQTVPDDKMPPFKLIDSNDRGLKIVKDETIVH